MNLRTTNKLIFAFLCTLYILSVFLMIRSSYSRTFPSSFQRWEKFSDYAAEQKIFYRYPGHKTNAKEYPHLPIMYILMSPFHQMNHLCGAVAWMTLKFIMVLIILYVCWDYTKECGFDPPPWLTIGVLCLSFRYFKSDLANGNVDLLIGGIIACSLHFFRKSNDIACGILMGLAAVLKLTPLLFLPYFFLKRMWKCFIVATIAILLFIFVLPAIQIGWNYNLKLCHAYYRQMIEPFVSGAKSIIIKNKISHVNEDKKNNTKKRKKTPGTNNIVRGYKNQCLSAVVLRLCSKERCVFKLKDKKTGKKFFYKTYINFFSWKKSTAIKISKGLSLLLFLLIMYFCRTNLNSKKHMGFLGEFALIFLATLCISDRTWKIHGTLLIFAHTFLCLYIYLKPQRKFWPTCVLGLNTFLYLISASFLVGKYFAYMMEAYGVHFWIYILLISGCIYCLKDLNAHSRIIKYEQLIKP